MAGAIESYIVRDLNVSVSAEPADAYTVGNVTLSLESEGTVTLIGANGQPLTPADDGTYRVSINDLDGLKIVSAPGNDVAVTANAVAEPVGEGDSLEASDWVSSDPDATAPDWHDDVDSPEGVGQLSTGEFAQSMSVTGFEEEGEGGVTLAGLLGTGEEELFAFNDPSGSDADADADIVETADSADESADMFDVESAASEDDEPSLGDILDDLGDDDLTDLLERVGEQLDAAIDESADAESDSDAAGNDADDSDAQPGDTASTASVAETATEAAGKGGDKGADAKPSDAAAGPGAVDVDTFTAQNEIIQQIVDAGKQGGDGSI